MANVDFKIEDAVTMVRLFQECEESLGRFVAKGAQEISDCSIQGEQKKKIDDALEVIQTKSKFAKEGLSNISDAIKKIIENVMKFNANDVFNMAKEEAERAKAGDDISVATLEV